MNGKVIYVVKVLCPLPLSPFPFPSTLSPHFSVYFNFFSPSKFIFVLFLMRGSFTPHHPPQPLPPKNSRSFAAQYSLRQPLRAHKIALSSLMLSYLYLFLYGTVCLSVLFCSFSLPFFSLSLSLFLFSFSSFFSCI
jgi:hypothetical protein